MSTVEGRKLLESAGAAKEELLASDEVGAGEERVMIRSVGGERRWVFGTISDGDVGSVIFALGVWV